MSNPIVSTITPDASTVGCRIKVTGSNLDSVTKATVGGVDCAFEHVTDAILIVVVAAGAKSGTVLVSNDEGSAGTAPIFTVTMPAKPKVETKAEQTAREQFEAEQKVKADAEAQAQRDRQALEKAPLAPHVEPAPHVETPVAANPSVGWGEGQTAPEGQPALTPEGQQWPGKHKKW
jgi:hypothetical protein